MEMQTDILAAFPGLVVAEGDIGPLVIVGKCPWP